MVAGTPGSVWVAGQGDQVGLGAGPGVLDSSARLRVVPGVSGSSVASVLRPGFRTSPWEPGARGGGRCLFKVTACSGTTWGGQLGTGHLTDSGLTSGSPLVCGTRSA